MNADLAQELLNEIGSTVETLETQHEALLQFLKDNGTLTDDQFAPYLAQAGKASSVRWRAARIRLQSLISAAKQEEEKHEEDARRQSRAEKAPGQNQEPEAKAENNVDSTNAAPPNQEAKDKGAVENAADQSDAKEEDKQAEPAASKA